MKALISIVVASVTLATASAVALRVEVGGRDTSASDRNESGDILARQSDSWPIEFVQLEHRSGRESAWAASLDVFGEETQGSPSHPDIVSEEFRILDDPDDRVAYKPWGRLVMNRVRSLIDSTHDPSIRAYGVPTQRNWVCYVVFIEGRGRFLGCDAKLTDGLTVHVDRFSPRGPAYVFGLVAGSATGASAQFGTDWHRGIVGRNAFLIKGPPGRAELRGMKLEYASGRTRDIEID